MPVHTPDDPDAFPAEIPVKVMGEASDEFESWVVSTVRRHVPDLGEGAVTTRQSRRGRYVSVTVTVMARSREQMDALYRELSADERVKVAL